MAEILLIEDEDVLRRTISDTLERSGHSVRAFDSAEKGLESLEDGAPDLIVTDNRLPGMSGRELLDQVRESYEGVAVVLITAHGTIEDAVSAMKAGAVDYLSKPVDLHELLLVVERSAAGVNLKKELAYYRSRDRLGDAEIIGDSGAMRSVRTMIERLAGKQKRGGGGPTVLLSGETGTGKGLIARALHQASPRAAAPFIEINCAALPENLLEAELMGYERGAFTGAVAAKAGLFEAAEGGTIFLDEIGRMPPKLQTKLLKVIEDRSVRRLGSTRARPLSCSVVTASHVDLEDAVAAGTFLPDLYHRIAVFRIECPPLRERGDDVVRLAEHFVELHAADYGLAVPVLTAKAKTALAAQSWPGNIRELSHAIERAVVLGRGETLDVDDLSFFSRGDATPNVSVQASGRVDVDFSSSSVSLDNIEAQVIRQAMEHAGGNQVRAARILGISRDALRYRLDKHDIG